MEEQKKSRKPLLVGVIAAVVVLAALLALLLTQCVGGTGPSDTSGTETTAPAVQGYQLYWNVDRNNFEVEVEGESTTGRKPADDGFYHMVFAVDGKQVELRVKERRLVKILDAFDIMGLVFDENGDVIDIIRLDDMPIQKITWQYYIQSFGGNAIKLNSSKDMNGMEEMIKTNDQTVIYDVSGWSEFVGAPGKLQKNDRAYVIANEAGEITHIFLYERDGIERTMRAECKHCGEEVTWKNWLRSDVLPTTTGHYFLENNVNTNRQNQIQDDAQICLDLNGYQIYSKSTARIYSTFYAGSSLVVMDNSEEKKGIIISEGQNMDQGSCLWARYGNIDIYDITIDGSGATSHAGGTAVCVESTSTIHMHSGKLIGGKLVTVKGKGNAQQGGAVRVAGNGKFIMDSGIITGGESPKGGGAVYVGGNGTFTMNGGKITNGRVKGTNGGNVAVAANATFIMNSGTISGGRAYRSDKNANGAGGNVYINGTFNMYGGTITDGRCYNYDGTRVENELRQNFFNVNGKLYMYGGKITGYVQATDTNTKDNKPTIVYVSGGARISGAAEGGTNLTLNKGVKFQAGKLSGKAEIYVKASGIFSDKTRESNVNYVHSDDPTVNVVYYDGCLALGRIQCICGASLTEGKAHVGICDGTLQFFGPYVLNGIDTKSSGNYYLTKDYDKVGQLSFGNSTTKDADGKTVYPDPITVNLDLNGYTINSTNRSVLAMSMTTLNITDSVGGGKITGRGVTLPYTNAGVLLIQKFATINILGDLTLDGRDDMHETMNTGGVAEVSGTLNVYDGVLDGGPVGGSTNDKGVVQKGSAGAVMVNGGGIVNLYGDAKITNGVTKGSSAHGGNVYIKSNGQLNMFDNSIIENGAAAIDNKGGGGNVYIAAGGAMSMQDNAQIINGQSDPNTQPHSKDIFCVNGKIYMNGGHIGTMALSNWNANSSEMVVANNASVDSLRMTFGNDAGKSGATKTSDIQIVGVLTDDSKIVLNAPKVGYFTTETVAENQDNFATSNNQKIYFNAKHKKLSVGEVGDPLYHCVCGMQYAESLDGTVTSKGTCFGTCDGEIHEWQPWTGSTMPNKSGYWVMSEGTYSTANVKTAEEIYVDLNGRTVSVKEKNRAWRFEGSLDGHEVKLVITDFAGGGTVKSLEATGDHSILMWGYRPSYDLDKDEKAVKETPTYLTVNFDLYGGHLDASAYTCQGIYGTNGAIEVGKDAKINLYGGKISGANVAGTPTVDEDTKEVTKIVGKGGAFTLATGTVMTMSGNAEIVGGSVPQNGGAIYMNGGATLIMSGNSKITGGKVTGAPQGDTHGGSLYMASKSVLVMNDNASITGGSAMNAYTYVDMNTGATKHRSAQGGNIYANGSITLNGNASITGGACDSYALTEPDAKAQNADIFLVGANASLTMNGGRIGYITVASNAGKISLSGAPVVESFMLNNGWVMDITGTLDDAADITLLNPAMGLFTGETVAENADNFKTTNNIPVTYSRKDKKLNVGVISEPIYHCVCGMKTADSIGGTVTSKGTCFGECTGEIKEWQPWTGSTLPNQNGYWFLTTDNTSYGNAIVGEWSGTKGTTSDPSYEIYVDLNGKTSYVNAKTRAYSFGKANVVELTITDSVGGGQIINKEASSTDQSMMFWNRTTLKPMLNIYGGTMDSSKAVNANASYGGQGAVHLGANAEINMFGGTVIGMDVISNKSSGTLKNTGSGGAFYLSNGTVMAVTGGEIIGSHVSENGGAIYVGSGATLAVDGATVTGGKAAQGATIWSAGNVYLRNATVNGGVAQRDTENNKGGRGAALYVNSGNLVLDNTVVNGGHVSAMSATDAGEAYGGNALFINNGTVEAINGTKLNGYTAEHSNVRRGGTVYMMNGSFTLNNSTISGSKVQVNGAAVQLTGGTITMTGENAAITMADVGTKTYGGAVTISGGTFNLEDGVINGTEVTYTTGGGAVALIDSNAKLVMTGGKITGGSAKQNNGGGVCLKSGTVSISGDAQITGNTGGNLYILEGAKLEVGTMAATANVGITLSSGTGVFSSNTVAATTGFVSDNTAYEVALVGEKLAIQDPSNPLPDSGEPSDTTTDSSEPSDTTPPAQGDSIFHCLCGKKTAESLNGAVTSKGDCLEGCDGTIYEWTKWEDTTKLPNTNGYYYLADNVTTSATANIGEAKTFDEATAAASMNVAIDLNGMTVTSSAIRVFVLGNSLNTTLTITDTVGTGVIYTRDCTNGTTSVDQGAFLWNRAAKVSTVNIFGGTIDASKSDTNLKTPYGGQGAIEIGQQTGTTGHVLNIAGGTIKGQNISKNFKVNNDKTVTTTAWTGNGGAIYVKGTTVTISGDAKVYGSNISGNGGAIYVGKDASLTLKGNAQVIGGHAMGGGNIYVENIFTMDGGLVTQGTSGTAEATKHGGGIFGTGASTITINGGKITENTATIGGGGIYTNGNLIITGGEITGNTAASTQSGNFDINGIGAEVTMSGGKVGIMSVNAYQTDASMTISGAPVIEKLSLSKQDKAATGTSAAITPDFPAIKLAAGKTLEKGTSIGLSVNTALRNNNLVFTEANAAFKDYEDYFRSADGTYTAKFHTDGEYANKLQLVANYYCLCATKTGEHMEGCDGTKYEWSAWDISTKKMMPNVSGHWYLTGTPPTGISVANIGNLSGGAIKLDQTATYDVAVDLRGMQIKVNGNSRIWVFGESASTKLSITDSVGGATVTHNAKDGADQAMIMWNRFCNDATVNFFGGTFDPRASVTNANSQYGGQGAMEMLEGDTINITGNTVIYGQEVTKGTSGKGGVLKIDSRSEWAETTTLKISGDAKVYGSTVSAFGGAICSESAIAITMKDNAELVGGTAAIRGGAIYMSAGGSLTMSDNAKIRDGKVVSTLTELAASGNTSNAPWGGNIYTGGTATITMSDNAIISGGVVDAKSGNNHGGNIYMNGANQTLIMSGNAKITGGNAMNGQGGNLYTNGTITMSGNAEITGGKLNTNATAVNADVFAVNGNLNMSGNTKVGYFVAYNTEAAGTNVVKLEGEPVITQLTINGGGGTDKDIFTKITIVGTLGDNASICVNMNTPIGKGIYEFTTTTVAENEDYFTSPQGNVVFMTDTGVLRVATPDMYCLCAASKTGAAHKNGCNGEIVKWTKWEKTDSLPNTDGYYYLNDNVTANTTYIGTFGLYDANATATSNIAIDLNGKTVTVTGGRAFVLGTLKTATFTITDSVGTGVINTKDCSSGTTSVDQGSILWNRGTGTATVNIFGGTLDASKSDTNFKTQYGGRGAIDMGAESAGKGAPGGHILNIAGGIIKGQNITKDKVVTSSNGSLVVGTAAFSGNGGAIYIQDGTVTISGDAQVHGGNVSGNGGAIYIKNSTLNMIGGTVYGGNAINGGTIYSESGSIEMSAGTITGGVASTSGGVVYLNGGYLTMTGGTISGGSTPEAPIVNATYGGCLYVNAARVDMSGGTITGGVVANADTTDGASYGGNVYTKGIFNMSGTALITEGVNNGGNANSHGGNVSVQASGFYMSGNAKVTNGHANKGQGGNIHIVTNLIISGNAEVTGGEGAAADAVSRDIFSVNGKINMDGGHIGALAMTNTTDSVSATVVVKGAAKIDAANFGSHPATKPLANMMIDGALTDGACIKINTCVGATHIARDLAVPLETWATYKAYLTDNKIQSTNANVLFFTNDGIVGLKPTEGKYNCLCGSQTGVHLTGCDSTPHEWKAWTGNGMPNQAGYWYMEDDTKTYSQGVIKGNGTEIYVDLNGKTINYNTRAFRFDTTAGATAAESMYLTITDSVGGGSANLKGDVDNHSTILMGYKNGTTFTPEVTFTLYGGHLNAGAGNCTGSWEQNGAINVGANATINMYGGKITGQTVNGYGSSETVKVGKGGAVYLTAGSNMVMTGDAEIVGGAVAQNGGSVYMDANTTLTMSGNAKISGGSTTGTTSGDTHGGNVSISGGATLTMSGNAQITGGSAMNSFDNRAAYGGNLYIASNGTLEISGNASISGGASMTDATATAPVATDSRADIFNVGGTITMDGGYIGRLCCATSVPGTINVGGKAEILRLQTPSAVKITKALETGASITTNKGVGTKVAENGTWSATDLATFAAFFHGTSNTVGVAEADGIYLRAQ